MQEENKWVNIENAILLKELGYDIPCICRFSISVGLDNSCMGIEDTKAKANWNAIKDSMSIPTFEDVRIWLHDNYQIAIGMSPSLWGYEPGKEIDKSKILWFCRSNFGVSDGYNYNEVYNKELSRILNRMYLNQ